MFLATRSSSVSWEAKVTDDDGLRLAMSMMMLWTASEVVEVMGTL